MDSWIILGLGAAILFGFSAVAARIATGHDYFGIPPSVLGILTLLGITFVFIPYLIATQQRGEVTYSPRLVAIGLAVGVFWAAATILQFTALKQGADISRLAPLYNMNTLVAVVLGIILLGELPEKAHAIRVLTGAALIVLGGILVSM
ncbi:EamA family transporter [Candidatus Altiarchaeota archaeon]